MKRFKLKSIVWNEEKNFTLLQERWICFEDVLVYINRWCIVKIQESHYNDEKYPNQKIIYLDIEKYIYIIPFIENDDEIFLKTVIPSRKYTKMYLWK